MAKIKVIKKNDEYSSDYKVGDILEVTGTWYGGFNVNSVTGIPLCLDKDECEEILEKTDLSHEEYEAAASYWKKKDAESVKLDEAKLKKAVEKYILANKTCALATGAGEFVRCTPIEYTYHHGCILDVFRRWRKVCLHWKRIRMFVWLFLINMRALAN